MSTIAERVAAGAAFLDEHKPGWADLIDVGKLHIESTCECVLGQLAGSYIRGIDRYQLGDSRVLLGFMWVGLDPYDDDLRDVEDAEISALTAEWKRVITERRAAS